jgi:hypothetical protein
MGLGDTKLQETHVEALYIPNLSISVSFTSFNYVKQNSLGHANDYIISLQSEACHKLPGSVTGSEDRTELSHRNCKGHVIPSLLYYN